LSTTLAGVSGRKKDLSMGRARRGTVSGRQRQKAIKLLATVTDDEKAALYLRVQAARSLLAQRDPEDDDDEDEAPPRGFTIVLPSNGRDNIIAERELARLEAEGGDE
jgi:hypothetical protein